MCYNVKPVGLDLLSITDNFKTGYTQSNFYTAKKKRFMTDKQLLVSTSVHLLFCTEHTAYQKRTWFFKPRSLQVPKGLDQK